MEAMRIRLILCAALLTLCAPLPSLAADGQALFNKNGCGECHAVTPPVSPAPTGAERVLPKGPPLWFTGSKLNPGWLEGWLRKPVPVRGLRYDAIVPDTSRPPHPALPKPEARAVAAWLETLTDPDMRRGVIPSGAPSRHDMLQGRILFSKKQQCFACHRIVTRFGDAVGGTSGPNLSGMARRLNPDWVFAYLTDPLRYEPNSRMPLYRGTDFEGYSDTEFVSLVRYLLSMGEGR